MESSKASPSKKELLNELFRIGAIKLGSFKLKSGIISPIYIDMRVIISYPSVISKIGSYMYKNVTEAGAKFEVICGVPYTALPIASSISLEQNIPMLIRRKEGAKEYGTRKALEGVFTKEDLVTTGGSAIEVAESLRNEGLFINDVVVFLDREQGAEKLLQQKNLRLHSVISMSEMLSILEEENKLEKSLLDSIRSFISGSQFAAPAPPKRLTYAEKAKLVQHPISKRLLEVIEAKKSNLSVAVDVTTKKELLDITDQVGPSICLLKTHIDILEDFDANFIGELKKLSEKHNFLIFEDRKFADIGNTVQLQYEKGIYRIADWAHIVNAHTVPGPGIIEGLKKVGLPKQRALLLLAEMSSGDLQHFCFCGFTQAFYILDGNLTTGGYKEETLRIAKAHKDFVIGFVSRKELVPDDPSFLYFTPGVRLEEGKDALGQTYLAPASVLKSGSDVIIVGRGIYTSGNIAKVAEEYRKAGWDAYQALIQSEF